MGWGTYFKADMCLSKISINEIEDKLKEIEDLIAGYEKELLVLSASTPRNVKIDDSEWEWSEYIIHKSNEIFEELKELYINKYKFELALENKEILKEG